MTKEAMTPGERMLAVLKGEEPDKTPVCVYDFFLAQTGPEWYWRLKQRGLALVRYSQFCRPQLAIISQFFWEVNTSFALRFCQAEHLVKPSISSLNRPLAKGASPRRGVAPLDSPFSSPC